LDVFSVGCVFTLKASEMNTETRAGVSYLTIEGTITPQSLICA